MNKAMEIGDLIGGGWPILVGFLAVVIVAFIGYRLWRGKSKGLSMPSIKLFGQKPKNQPGEVDVPIAPKANGKVYLYDALIFRKNMRYQKPVKATDIRGDEYPLPRLLNKKNVVILEELEQKPAEQIVAHPAVQPAPLNNRKVKVPVTYKGALEYLEMVGGDGKAEEASATPLSLPVAQTQYKEFQPQRLPEKYQHMTPSWLYRKLHWKDKVEFLRIPPDQGMGKVKIGMMVVVIAIFALVILLTLLSSVGGKS